MVYLLNNTPYQLSKLITKYCVEANDDLRGTYNTKNQIKFKTLMPKSILCDYSDAYMLVKETITLTGQGAIT